MKKLRWRLQGLLDLVLETPCPLCQRSTNSTICPSCQQHLRRCQLPKLPAGQDSAVLAWGHYSGTLKRAIAALKYENQRALARPLGHWLGQTWLNAPLYTGELVVVPIPMHASKLKERGFNQAALLAESFCEWTRLPLALDGLERHRATDAQFTLSATQREQNLSDAFSLGGVLRQATAPPTVLLLDDIYTTGATARSAIKTLRRHGVRVAGIAVVAQALQHTATRSP